MSHIHKTRVIIVSILLAEAVATTYFIADEIRHHGWPPAGQISRHLLLSTAGYSGIPREPVGERLQ